MRLLLGIIEDEMDDYREGRTPDFDVMRMIAEYTLHYPDLVHHPKEDLVFARLIMRDPEAQAMIGDLVEEHKQLATLSRQLAAAVGNAARDVELPREWLHSLATKYISANRQHIEAEEKHFFPRVLAVLTDEDWAEIDKWLADRDDPVFGARVEDAYLFLHEQILRLHV